MSARRGLGGAEGEAREKSGDKLPNGGVSAQSHGMNWLWLLAIPFLLVALILWMGRRHVCIRRRDCCGKGCGCLFPVKLK